MNKYKYKIIKLAEPSSSFNIKQEFVKKLNDLYDDGYEFVNQTDIYVTIRKLII